MSRSVNTYRKIGADHLPGVELEFLSEHYPGDPLPLDTTVNIAEGTLCAITWADRDKFAEALQAVIDQFKI